MGIMTFMPELKVKSQANRKHVIIITLPYGHVSVQTTERYLGCKQRFRNAVNERIGLEPDPPG
jgi:hypothetical protein